MGMTETKTEAVRVNVAPGMRAELERVAAERDVSVAHVIRRAISAYLQDKGQVTK